MLRTGSYGTCTTSLAKSIVYNSNSSCLTDSVVIYLFFLIGNRTIRTHICTLGASVAKKLVRMCGTWVGGQLVFARRPIAFTAAAPACATVSRNILWSLADTGKENTSCRGLYRTKLCMCFCEEVVGINTCGKLVAIFLTSLFGSMAAARTTISASIRICLFSSRSEA